MTPRPIGVRRLGRTDVSLSEFGLGTAPLGDLFAKVDDEEAAELIEIAWEGGARYFDTSPWYGRGQAEHRLGRALYRRRRDDYVLSTKIGRLLKRPLKPGPFARGQWIGGLEFETVFDYGYDGVMRSFEDSLQRLGINRVDLLLVHDLDGWSHRNAAAVDAHFDQLIVSGWRALAELRDSGAIGGIGAGVNMSDAIPRFLDAFDIDFFLLAMRYTLLETDVLDDVFPRCAERGVGIVIGGGYNSGILATGAVPGAMYNYAPASPDILDRVAKIDAVCKRHNVPIAAAALQFPLGHPIVASIVPGAIKVNQVERNLAAFRLSLPADLWAELKHEKLLRADAPTPSEWFTNAAASI
ncbi:D-threo-aldose 1-dehydrogenase [Roseiarcus fermentans]|uniref:D-threo-aldose 1-dehydrogenase n=1 Tax=Roseiarcus fermentans TaxID=1473586 RepID=A0A366FDP9_9HYPH|nr:aldo/keto reductase [Roseiarcus fermentans]RBP12216.1 D-threo-aldose 1-dehydrogenase [Roseiarcus fermentans]